MFPLTFFYFLFSLIFFPTFFLSFLPSSLHSYFFPSSSSTHHLFISAAFSSPLLILHAVWTFTLRENDLRRIQAVTYLTCSLRGFQRTMWRKTSPSSRKPHKNTFSATHWYGRHITSHLRLILLPAALPSPASWPLDPSPSPPLTPRAYSALPLWPAHSPPLLAFTISPFLSVFP